MDWRMQRIVSWWLAVVSVVCLRLDLGASINDEVRALLRFKQEVEFDPFGVLVDWNEEEYPCFWFGVHCDRGNVVALSLKDLGLRGKLVPELGKLIHLKYLVLRNNSFYGIIPQEIASLQNLEVLDLGYNNLSGPVPFDFDLARIFPLKILILRNNEFISSMPHELEELNVLSELLFDEEQLSLKKRSVTRSTENATIRRLLQVGNQNKEKPKKNGEKQGKVINSPAPAPSNKGKQSKDTQNQTKFPVSPSRSLFPSKSPFLPPTPAPVVSPTPVESASVPAPGPLSLRHIDPPSIVLPNQPDFNASSPSSSISTVSPTESAMATPATSQRKHSTLLTMYMSIAGAVSFLLAISVVYIICWQANKVVTIRPWATGLSGQLQKAFVTGVPALKRSELEVACEGFSNIIGSLSDCMLYKGTLSSGVEIAVISSMVKSTKDWSKQSETQFRKKVTMLSKVNHKNFVNLLGYCEEGEPFTRMMVFEYAPNGTLFEHLHIKESEHLDWSTRLRVAMGIAYCLEHMHQLDPPFILRSLDSSSIYLTDDYAAKLSDLEFWGDEGSKSASGNLAPLVSLPGTDSIVYRFGALLLETISGKFPFTEEGILGNWFSCNLNGEKPLKDLIDPSLQSFNEESAEALCKVINSCIHPDPKERPTMAQVASQLRDITAMPPDGATPKVSPLWWAELEIISSEAN